MHGSYKASFYRNATHYSENEQKAKELRTLVIRAIQAGKTVTVDRTRIADIRLSHDRESLVYYHGDENGNIIYRDYDSGYPVCSGLYPNTLGYYEVYEQVKQYK